MTITINQTADTITFSHPILDTTILSMGLTTTKSCGTAPIVFNLDANIPSITDNTLVVTSSDLFNTSKFEDGVYEFTLKLVKQIPLSIRTTTFISTNCFVVDYDLKCLYLKKQLNDYDNLLAEKYKSLMSYDSSCTCKTKCLIYKDILQSLTTKSTMTNDTGCGC